jgi:hypothetical protein
MSNRNLRNSELLGKLERHPLKATLARALDIAEAFAGDVEYLSLNTDLSPPGRAKALQSKLRAAIRDLRDSRAPIGDLQAKLDTKCKAVAMPKFDPADVVGFLRRQELRAALRTMDTGQRELTLNDPAFADAMLEQPPVLSGLFLAADFKGTISPEIQRDRDIVAAAKEKRLAGMFGRELEEIAALEQTVAEANMIADVARVDLQLHFGMEPRVFAEFVKPVEAKQNAPWLRKDKDAAGNERTIVIDVERHSSRVATEREILDGKFYRDHAEYLADRAA